MLKTTFFSGIPRSDAEKFTNCMSSEIGYYMQGEEIIFDDFELVSRLLVVDEGSVRAEYAFGAHVYKHEILKKGEAAGKLFFALPPGEKVRFFSETDSSILFFDFARLLRPCENACYYHTAVLSNLFKMASERISEANLHLSILKAKNSKEKILSFLEHERINKKSDSFEIDKSQEELSDYLCLERSALSRSISLLRKEGAFKSKGRRFSLPPSDTD